MQKNKPVILVLNGPNLNMLGKREPEVYGSTTLDEINEGLKRQAEELGVEVQCFQSNSEGALVTRIQEAFENADGIIINPAAYTHTSVAIRDALLLHDVPIIELHLSNVYKRDEFRHKSFVSGVATAQMAGFGAMGYNMALQAMADMVKGG
ncbi:3-dehydroquinate dehydratase [Desulfatibacillum alkenivorans DSM 16219]|jgi:3-dehydroquinate dehydratase-2|uniref:3-dehydroquinate dehydratase n=1 Tax=Desulfatibacillum alkenivorans DSM 16219 TaxID=1121393 RepID=A0A1M6PGC9_9BACT|nr:type II 3-dehydroquinate dehydratase [Desulfatibacillum alkenivorans]SHK06950.1 3-dehydroquinate dehydratase [Desulfatibacillum alkenivorans DSM 16219]